jgi:hypothetical protein
MIILIEWQGYSLENPLWSSLKLECRSAEFDNLGWAKPQFESEIGRLG